MIIQNNKMPNAKYQQFLKDQKEISRLARLNARACYIPHVESVLCAALRNGGYINFEQQIETWRKAKPNWFLPAPRKAGDA